MAKKVQKIRGRDVSAPVKHITINGVTYPLVFNNNMARIAEDVYEEAYGKDVGYQDILKSLARGKYSATMAMYYAAMVAGGAEISWEDFDRDFRIDQIEGVREILAKGITQSLPTEDTDEDNAEKDP